MARGKCGLGGGVSHYARPSVPSVVRWQDCGGRLGLGPRGIVRPVSSVLYPDIQVGAWLLLVNVCVLISEPLLFQEDAEGNGPVPFLWPGGGSRRFSLV